MREDLAVKSEEGDCDKDSRKVMRVVTAMRIKEDGHGKNNYDYNR